MITLLRADENGELDEVEQSAELLRKRFLSGSLYDDSTDVFRLESAVEIDDEAGNVLMFLLADDGGLQVRIPRRQLLVDYGPTDKQLS